MLLNFTLVVNLCIVLVVLIFFSRLDYFVEFEQVMRLVLLRASRTTFDIFLSPASWCYSMLLLQSVAQSSAVELIVARGCH